MVINKYTAANADCLGGEMLYSAVDTDTDSRQVPGTGRVQ
jgi:hypothetical protein